MMGRTLTAKGTLDAGAAAGAGGGLDRQGVVGGLEGGGVGVDQAGDKADVDGDGAGQAVIAVDALAGAVLAGSRRR